jgi:putative ABC transport system substrate-binding protein
VKAVEGAARTLGLQVQILSVRDPGDLDGALSSAQGASALLQVDDAMLTTIRARIADLALKQALKHRLPSISGLSETVEAGGLMSHPHYGELYRQASTQVDKILRGTKPAGLPVEQPTRFELVITLRTAKALGLTIPPAVLARADEVIQ